MFRWFLVYCAVGFLVCLGIAIWQHNKGNEEASDGFLVLFCDPITIFLALPFWPVILIGALAIKGTGKYELSNKEAIDKKFSQHDLVGKIGVVKRELRPSGTVVIDDEVYDSLSIDGIIQSGARVKVLKKEGFSLNVVEVVEEEEYSA